MNNFVYHGKIDYSTFLKHDQYELPLIKVFKTVRDTSGVVVSNWSSDIENIHHQSLTVLSGGKVVTS